MKSSAVAVLAAVVLIGTTSARDNNANDEQTKLQGTWKVVSAENAGKPASAKFADFKLTFTGDKIIPLGGDAAKDDEASYKLDSSKTPKEIDIIPTKGKDKDKRIVRGIYQLEGDTLKLALSPPTGKKSPDGTITYIESKRPTALDSKHGLLFVLKKDKS